MSAAPSIVFAPPADVPDEIVARELGGHVLRRAHAMPSELGAAWLSPVAENGTAAALRFRPWAGEGLRWEAEVTQGFGYLARGSGATYQEAILAAREELVGRFATLMRLATRQRRAGGRA